ncbi:hypothetical protein OPV22_016448 [Ensete ventricosum]|uniref:Uncharacterized protein n=1 Tax=Ensete ventricosum TaxID=4639 RepID=A0AAV8QZY7_ENSVE|nr:hypothetical protein OPV22_016448 [Ensete ventricosum]
MRQIDGLDGSVCVPRWPCFLLLSSGLDSALQLMNLAFVGFSLVKPGKDYATTKSGCGASTVCGCGCCGFQISKS